MANTGIQIPFSGSRNETKNSTKWFGDQVSDLIKNKNILKTTSTPEVGRMFLYVYDPKFKDILPFYDMFPLTIPIRFDNSGFLGLNLHYLPPLARSSLLSQLSSLANNNKYDDTTKLNVSYDVLLSGAHKFAGFKDCIKRYLFGYVRSSFHQIEAQDWSKVVLLPLQNWRVNSNAKYADNPPY